MYFMIQGDDPLEVNLESNLEEHEQLSCDDLASYCEELPEKYDLMKKIDLKLKKENGVLFSKFDIVLKEKEIILKENNSLENKIELISKEKVFISHANVTSSNIEKMRFVF